MTSRRFWKMFSWATGRVKAGRGGGGLELESVSELTALVVVDEPHFLEDDVLGEMEFVGEPLAVCGSGDGVSDGSDGFEKLSDDGGELFGSCGVVCGLELSEEELESGGG